MIAAKCLTLVLPKLPVMPTLTALLLSSSAFAFLMKRAVCGVSYAFMTKQTPARMTGVSSGTIAKGT